MTTPASSRLASPPRRMLTKRQAADYFGLTPAKFVQVCTVAPYDLGGDLRWDVKRLDEMLDGFEKTTATMTRDDWMGRMDLEEQ